MNKCIIWITVLFSLSCINKNKHPRTITSEQMYLIDTLNKTINEAIIQDGFSPPVASRIYAYCNLAAYEAFYFNSENKLKTETFLNDYSPDFNQSVGGQFDPDLSMLVAFSDVALEMVYRDFIIKKYYQEGLDYYRNKLDETTFNTSLFVGQAVAKYVLKYASKDMYNEYRSYPLYEIIGKPWSWEPTPPIYGTAIEPHFGKLRPFVYKDIKTIEIKEVNKFDTIKGSDFYNMNLEVYEAGKNITKNQKEIAMHWDGDPMPPYRRLNHINIIKRQLNPIGHFLGIGRILSHKLKESKEQAVENYMRISLACADAMIGCWDKKYKYNLIRPHTYINRYIDVSWDPLLITPLFPEYPSAHSCLAGAAVGVMINLFSDTVSFVDNTGIDYGKPLRSFDKLSDAAKECALSRLYAGVHYKLAIYEGLSMGETVANYHLNKAARLRP